ncbi:MAG TPA: ABC transporter permease [Terriglobia bacterium]|nr:ABC transporter permease [Terriglobia bacterium]
MSTVLQDVRFGFRMLAKNPGFAAVAVLTLALGIGANLTVFSWIRGTLLDPVPGVTHTADLVSVMRGERSEHPMPPFSYPDYVDLRREAHSLSGLLAYHHDWVTLTGLSKPERVYGENVSANYFDVLGVKPLLGRVFNAGEEEKRGSTPPVVISYAFWQSHFGGDPAIIGKSIQLERTLCVIVGVAPPGFQACATGVKMDLWAPLVYGDDNFSNRGDYWLNVMGRLAPGVSRRHSEQELNLLMQRLVAQYPDTHRGPNQITLDPVWRSPFSANVYLAKSLPMLLALAAVLLLLACANVANLLLVRGVARRREIALRLSMGASRWRLVRQFFLESLLLSLAASAVALLVTNWTAGTFAGFFPTIDLPLAINGRADFSVFLVALLASVITAMIFGVLPALRISRLAPVSVLKEEALNVSGGLHRSRLSTLLIVTQIALSFLLLICAGLFARSMENAQHSDLGFDPRHVMLASFQLSSAGYSEGKGMEFCRQLLGKLADLPGVQSATVADFSPLSFTIHTERYVQPEGYNPRPHESMEMDLARVGPNYLRTLGTALVAGREFTFFDVAGSQSVAMVNEEFAARYWPGDDPLGREIRLRGRSLTVVGVVRNAKYRLLTYSPAPCIFLPVFQDYDDPLTVHVRVAGDPQTFGATLERSIHGLNSDLPVFQLLPLSRSMQMGSVFQRVAATFAGALGLLALTLASIGIYGIVAYTTRQRTREIGIRMALGARRGHVLILVLRQGLFLTAVGLAMGFGLAYAVTPLLRSKLYGVAATDSATYTCVAGMLCAVALIACYIPANRATKVEPVVALRHE